MCINVTMCINVSMFIIVHCYQCSMYQCSLGVLIDSHLRWHARCQNIVQKSSRILNLLRQSLSNCTMSVKSLAYKALVRPCLEYASVVWNPHTALDINKIETVQKRAA